MRHWACTHVQKRQHFRQRQLSHRGLGEGDYGTRSHTAEPYSCLQVRVSLFGKKSAIFPVFNYDASPKKNSQIIQKNFELLRKVKGILNFCLKIFRIRIAQPQKARSSRKLLKTLLLLTTKEKKLMFVLS